MVQEEGPELPICGAGREEWGLARLALSCGPAESARGENGIVRRLPCRSSRDRKALGYAIEAFVLVKLEAVRAGAGGTTG